MWTLYQKSRHGKPALRKSSPNTAPPSVRHQSGDASPQMQPRAGAPDAPAGQTCIGTGKHTRPHVAHLPSTSHRRSPRTVVDVRNHGHVANLLRPVHDGAQLRDCEIHLHKRYAQVNTGHTVTPCACAAPARPGSPKHFRLAGSGHCLCWPARRAPASGTARNGCRRKRGRFSPLAPLALQCHRA